MARLTPIDASPIRLCTNIRPQDLGPAEPAGAANNDGDGTGIPPARKEILFNSLGSTAQAVRLYGGEVSIPVPVLIPSPSFEDAHRTSLF